jgi:transposase
MTQQPAEIQVKDINHLGIVAGIIDQMGWVEAVVGVTQAFTTLAMKAVEQFGVSMRSIHLDSSSFHVDGEYLSSSNSDSTTATSELEASGDSTSSQERCDEQPKAITITHGYSRDHRPDLKQFIIDTICTADGDVPLFLRVADGKEDDKTAFAKLFEKFREQWTFEGLCVADSALYTADNLIAMKQLKWLTRVPLTLAQAKQVLWEIQANEWRTSSHKGYRIAERRSHYGGVEQRWLIVESEQRKQADMQQLHKRIDKEHSSKSVKLRQLSAQVFACEPDAHWAAIKFEQSLKYHRLAELKFIAQPHYDKAGRPRQDEQPTRITYCVQATLVPNPEVIEVEMTRVGRFILATNVLDATELSTDDALREYKDQQSNERGFRFLKDPLFFTSSVFVKSPKRVEALAMVMGLCLLVYSLAQRQLRQSLQQAGEGIKNQVGKLTSRPTLRWVFQSFQSVHLLIVDGVEHITNLTPERQKILRFLGTEARRYYHSG